MSFWDLAFPDSATAVIDAGSGTWTYRELREAVARVRADLPSGPKTLGFVFCRNTAAALSGYLAALRGKQAVCLLPADLHPTLCGRLLEAYRPAWVWTPEEGAGMADYVPIGNHFGYTLLKRRASTEQAHIHPELALLLSTSGTTGSPKMVRLSYRNLQSNAQSIARYLGLSAGERPITTLPMPYSYGLSVINSHLQVGAAILMTGHGVVNRDFWCFCKEERATSLAGVPYTYQMLHRLRFENMDLPALSTLTQAGGRLEVKLQEYLADFARRKGIRLFIMYGQTEATARISYVPPDRVYEGIGSIGLPIPGGRLEIDPASEELLYYGPNVMMGYAEHAGDLAKGDELNGRLATGDLAYRGDNGFFYLKGRKKRFIKLFGLRVNLDDIERLIERRCDTSGFCVGSDHKFFIVVTDPAKVSSIKQLISEVYNLNPAVFEIIVCAQIPRLSTGKVDYESLYKRYVW